MTETPERCGQPTKGGGLCRNYPMQGTDRCYVHTGLPPTAAEQAASRRNPVVHGYFVSGFLDDEERELFQQVLDGELDPAAVKREVIAALIVRAARMTKWEAEGQQVSGFTTDVYAELRQALDSVTPDELRLQHSWDDAEVGEQVARVLAGDPCLLIRLLPEGLRAEASKALGGSTDEAT